MTGRLVGVDLRRGEYLICVYSKTAKGVWVLDGAPARLPDGTSADQLGLAVHDALDRSRAGVDELTRDSEPARSLLDLLQLKDYATYMKGTRSVEVYSETTEHGETIDVTPQRNEGGRRGFTPIDDQTETFTYTTAEQLGEHVIKAIGQAV